MAAPSAAAATLAALAAVPGAAPAGEPGPPTRTSATIAELPTAVTVRARPGTGAVVGRVAPTSPWSGAPVGLLVLDARRDARDRLWLRVRLPRRPNDAAGWIAGDLARLTRTPWRIRVATRVPEVRLYRAGRLVRRWGAVVGTAGTPTPHGRFAVLERVRQSAPDGFLGPWALHLTAHSRALRAFDGGPGRVALHGRGAASLLDPLGTARSHGCVRLPNDAIRTLARVARPGTPVDVVARPPAARPSADDA